MKAKFEAVIVGLGPAGMAAAVELAKRGCNIAVLDENAGPGGQIYRQPPSDFVLEDNRILGIRHRMGHRLIEAFNKQRQKITVFSGTYVWGYFEGEGLAVLHDGEITRLSFDKLLLCEGAMERSIPFPGWTLPGIMTAGGLQKLLIQQRVLPGKRFVLSGSSPLLLSVAASLVKAGGQIAALCDATRKRENLRLIPELLKRKDLLRESISYLIPLLRKSVPTYRPYSVVSASGDSRVREVTIARLDRNWKPVSGTEKQLEVDGVGLNYGFLPLARLTRLCGCKHVYDPIQKYWKPETDAFMCTSVPNIYTAGDSAGIGGADLAELEGAIAGTHIAAELGRLSPAEREDLLYDLFESRNRMNRYSAVLNKIFALRPGRFESVDKNTVICRCEHITAGELFSGIENGYRNINEIKRTRVAMGPCQGRICESIITQLMIQKGIPIDDIGYLSLRPPLSPIPLSALEVYAKSSPETGPIDGHIITNADFVSSPG